MWQSLIVFCIVAAALLHLCNRYLPARWRRAGVALLARCGKPGARLAAMLEARAAGCGGGCSSCGSCGSDGKPAGAAAQPAESDSARVITLRPRQ